MLTLGAAASGMVIRSPPSGELAVSVAAPVVRLMTRADRPNRGWRVPAGMPSRNPAGAGREIFRSAPDRTPVSSVDEPSGMPRPLLRKATVAGETR